MWCCASFNGGTASALADSCLLSYLAEYFDCSTKLKLEPRCTRAKQTQNNLQRFHSLVASIVECAVEVKVGCNNPTTNLLIQALIQVVRLKYMQSEVFRNMFVFKLPAVSAALLVDASFQPDEREANAQRYKAWIHTRTGPYEGCEVCSCNLYRSASAAVSHSTVVGSCLPYWRYAWQRAVVFLRHIWWGVWTSRAGTPYSVPRPWAGPAAFVLALSRPCCKCVVLALCWPLLITFAKIRPSTSNSISWRPTSSPTLTLTAFCLRQCLVARDQRAQLAWTRRAPRIPTSLCSVVHLRTTRNGGRDSPSTWWRWGWPSMKLKPCLASSAPWLVRLASSWRTSPSRTLRRAELWRRSLQDPRQSLWVWQGHPVAAWLWQVLHLASSTPWPILPWIHHLAWPSLQQAGRPPCDPSGHSSRMATFEKSWSLQDVVRAKQRRAKAKVVPTPSSTFPGAGEKSPIQRGVQKLPELHQPAFVVDKLVIWPTTALFRRAVPRSGRQPQLKALWTTPNMAMWSSPTTEVTSTTTPPC